MTCILTSFCHEVYILIDPGSVHFFISRTFSMHTDREMMPLDCTLVVATPVGNSLLNENVFRDCAVRVSNKDIVTDLILLDIHDFDAILGMDWLANHRATVDYFRKDVAFRKSGESDIIFHGERRILPSSMISAISARRLLRKGCFAYLVYIIDSQVSDVKLEDIPMVKEFSDVFPNDLLGLPRDRDIEFTIDLVPGTASISMAPYRMTLLELRKLKVQLQELVDKGFIRPSVSLWGALVLFVKKNDGIMRLCIDYNS